MDISNNNISTNDKNAIPINLLNQYINALIANLEPKDICNKDICNKNICNKDVCNKDFCNKDMCNYDINLIFDSGAVNGLLGIGAALYIHSLEKKNLIKINKIAGCSIGSLIATWYTCGCPDALYFHMDRLFSYYKTNNDFYIYESIVRDVIYFLFSKEDDMSKINGKLYINYYDTQNYGQIVISHFTDREHLLTCILRSSHIPFITTKLHKYDGRYIDGIAPYVFDNNSKNLLVKLICLYKPLDTLKLKNEQNIYTRILRGLTGTNEFFVNGNTEICCYVNNNIKIQFLIRTYVVIIGIIIMDVLINIKNKMSPSMNEWCCYKFIKKMMMCMLRRMCPVNFIC